MDEESTVSDEWSDAYDISMEHCSRAFIGMDIQSNDTLISDNRAAWLMQSVAALLEGSTDPICSAVSLAFVASQLIVPSLSVDQRAQRLWTLDSKLHTYLVTDFYPRTLAYLGSTLAGATFFPDLDGNVFLAFLSCLIDSTEHDIEALVGVSSAQEIAAAWVSTGVALPDLSILSSFFKSKPLDASHSTSDHLFTLLPFSHPLLDKYLPLFSEEANAEPKTADDTRSRLEQLCDESFVDERHWHNSKSILPKHLGGRDDGEATNLTSWQRMKRLRKDQRFMTNCA